LSVSIASNIKTADKNSLPIRSTIFFIILVKLLSFD
jgi:hypothetical protein